MPPDRDQLWKVGRDAIDALTVPDGILASGKEELYGCIFGRDSLITSLLLMEAARPSGDATLLPLVRTVLLNLAKLQGTAVNIESGEEPGKIIHEFRPVGHEHLTKQQEHPWYLYPDGMMRSYDTVDATPLFLIALARYLYLSGDEAFVTTLLPNVNAALTWLAECGDANKDGFIDYRFHPNRAFGGLRVQSWMDSTESVFFEESDEEPAYSMAPVEVQAYAYRAYRDWEAFFRDRAPSVALELRDRAERLRVRFNDAFVYYANGGLTIPFAIDGSGRPLISTRSSIGHILWAAGFDEEGTLDCILATPFIRPLVERLMASDMFVPSAGIRTLSSWSHRFEANSYHNGSIWPHDTALVMLGLRNAGFTADASRVRDALLNSYRHFGMPLELFVFEKGFEEYVGPQGQSACRTQAWSAAGLLATITFDF